MDWLYLIKARLKKNPRLYEALTVVFSTFYFPPGMVLGRYLRYFNPESSVVLNIGSGPSQRLEGALNVDLARYGNVQINADAAALPVRDGSADGVVAVDVLEHIPDARRVVAEAHRVLKKGGILQVYVPFVYCYHASPGDFGRWSLEGLEALLPGFEKVESGVFGGPTSALLSVLNEWLALVFSFGSERLYKAMFLAFMAVLWPFKIADAVLAYHPMAKNSAAELYFIGRKA
jgi:SAM-dependent methyltransferase